MNVAKPLPRPSLVPLLAGWLAVAVALASARVLAGRPTFVVPAVIFAQVLTGLVGYQAAPTFRAAVDAVDTRALVAFHAVRAPIGAWFLLLMAQGALPPAFGLRGGFGDLVVGLSALGMVALASRRGLLRAWNTLGLLDIVITVLTAQKLALIDRDPRMLSAFGIAPFGLLPFFVVPLVFLTHLALFARTKQA